MKPLILAMLAASVAAGPANAQSPVANDVHAQAARAQLIDADGRPVGEATLRPSPHGVLVSLRLTKVAPGIHAVHIHQVGRCDRPSFTSAGGHFNPSNHDHGFLAATGVHAGDLPNIEIPSDMQYAGEYFVDGVTLEAGSNSLMDSDGSAIVVHAGKDDHMSNPAGNAGDRVACGPITRQRSFSFDRRPDGTGAGLVS
jgi:Cu-Zn family superoxide dismutase